MANPLNSSLVAIVGPTGSGKSALALAIAQAFHGEIVNFDSVQVYRDLIIGSAKTPAADRNGIPHHLLDVVTPHEDFTAGEFNRLARHCLVEITSRAALPVLVGGTGFYLRSLLDGLSPAPTRNTDLRERLTDLALRRPTGLHRLLKRLDPSAAQRIHANDHQKLIRAIELATTQSAIPPREPLEGFQITKIGLNPPRPELYARLNQRSRQMFARGLLEETKALLATGVPPEAKSLQSLGYKQALAVLQGRLTKEDAVTELQTRTRNYAKRQLTWFRHEPSIHWLEGFGESAEVQSQAIALISQSCRASLNTN